MAQQRKRRFSLLDLVAAVLVCGLIAAWLARSEQEGNAFLAYAMVFAIVGWGVIRSRRNAAVCEECGRRFSPPRPAVTVAVLCPHCGETQSGLVRSIRRWKALFWSMPFVIAPALIAAASFAMDASQAGEPLEGIRLVGVAVCIGLAGLAALAMIRFDVKRSRLSRPVDRPCESCGHVIPAREPETRICPSCRFRRASRDQAARQQADATRNILILVFIVAALLAGYLAATFHSMSRSGEWTGLPAILVMASATLLGLGWVGRKMIAARRWARRMSEEGQLATARRCAGEEGAVVAEGPITIWYSGPDDPTPLLREAFAGSRRRLATFLGEAEIDDPPIRVLAFHRRDALLAYYKESFPGLDLAAHAGLYFQQPYRLLMMSTEPARGRLDDPDVLAGSLYDLALKERALGTIPIPWLDTGLTKALVACGRPGDAARLNRRMVSALGASEAFAEDLFSMTGKALSRWHLRPGDPASLRKSEQFGEQSWSIVEHLGGSEAPDARRAAFRAFLKDGQTREKPAESFFRHFGFGFGSLIDAWISWVLDRGIGPDEPPPPRIRDALLNRVLPVIRDHEARPEERLQAIREWRQAGFVFGSDALIDLLREPGEIPREVVVWALRSVSGMPWGDEPGRWEAWWRDHPQAQAATPSVDTMAE